MAESRQALPAWFVREAIREFDLNPAEVVVWVVVADHMNAQRRAWPSQATIAEEGNVSRATVQRALPRLVELHLLTVVHESSRGRATEYEIPKRKPRVVRAQTLELPTRRAKVDDHTAAWSQAPLPPASTAPKSY